MTKFAAWLHTSRKARNYIGSDLVVDHTEFEGGWDFSIQWAPFAQCGCRGAIDKQLGLRLKLETIPTPVVVVDSIDEKPGPNPPLATKTLQQLPRPAQFEVASIRPSLPGERPGIEVQPGGRVSFRAWQLNLLVWMAWDISDPDEALVGAPKWLSPRSTPLFDIAWAGWEEEGVQSDERGDYAEWRCLCGRRVWVVVRESVQQQGGIYQDVRWPRIGGGAVSGTAWDLDGYADIESDSGGGGPSESPAAAVYAGREACRFHSGFSSALPFL